MSETLSVAQLSTPKSASEPPIVLLAATDRWVPTARLAMALTKAGCVVEAVCPAGHPIGQTRAVYRTHSYGGLRPLASFAKAIRASHADLVIPCDDLATSQLHALYKRECDRRGSASPICGLIERSIGAAGGFKLVSARNAFMQLAKQEGIRVPRTAEIANPSDLLECIAQFGFPIVLKADGTSGGMGVKIVKTVDEAKRAFRRLQGPPPMARSIKHAVVDRDFTLLWPSISRRRSVVNAQAFVSGREATSTIACWNGAVLASLHFEVIEKSAANGHATVVRRVDHPEMSAAAEKIAARLKLSGIHGLDFMLESETGNAYLIEINPRTTQMGHLTLGSGRDLPAALYAAVTGQRIQTAPKLTENETIALFPQEWKRDPASSYLSTAYHDVPWEEPALVSACVRGVRAKGQISQKLETVPAARGTVAKEKSSHPKWIADRQET